MASPLISCIVPVFNGDRYIREALDSILRQTYAPLEVVVADDGSTDDTASVVATYGERVRYVWQANAGPGAARNLGLQSVRGDFVAFLDADDVWHPDKLTRQMARFEARPELDLCVTRIKNFWVPELREEAVRFRDHPLARPMPGYALSTLLARRALFEGDGRFDPGLRHTNDTDWFVRAAERGATMDLLPDVLVFRRLHPANRSRRLAGASREEYLQLVKSALDRKRSGGPTRTG